MKEVVKTIFGIATSPEIIRLFDENKDGAVSWSEIWNSPTKKKFKATAMIGGDLLMKYGWLLIGLI